jgi:hypothetical protein
MKTKILLSAVLGISLSFFACEDSSLSDVKNFSNLDVLLRGLTEACPVEYTIGEWADVLMEHPKWEHIGKTEDGTKEIYRVVGAPNQESLDLAQKFFKERITFFEEQTEREREAAYPESQCKALENEGKEYCSKSEECQNLCQQGVVPQKDYLSEAEKKELAAEKEESNPLGYYDPMAAQNTRTGMNLILLSEEETYKLKQGDLEVKKKYEELQQQQKKRELQEKCSQKCEDISFFCNNRTHAGSRCFENRKNFVASNKTWTALSESKDYSKRLQRMKENTSSVWEFRFKYDPLAETLGLSSKPKDSDYAVQIPCWATSKN